MCAGTQEIRASDIFFTKIFEKKIKISIYAEPQQFYLNRHKTHGDEFIKLYRRV